MVTGACDTPSRSGERLRVTAIVLLAVSLAAACCAAAAVAAPAPRASAHSCWTAASPRTGLSLEPQAGRVEPEVLVQRLLARFGDTRFVKRIVLAPPPPYTFQHPGHWRGNPPPKDALWAYIAAPGMRPAPADPVEGALGRWELELVRRALRDVFCAAGGPPLVGTSVSGGLDHSKARGPWVQPFASPPLAKLRARIASAGERYGFRVVSLRVLHPLEAAPILVVETDRDPEAFMRDVPAILSSLHSGSYEGFFFEARDDEGLLTLVTRVGRGKPGGGAGTRAGVDTPYPHLAG